MSWTFSLAFKQAILFEKGQRDDEDTPLPRQVY